MKNNKLFKRIYIEITNRCNLSCKFCPTSFRKHQDMTVDNFLKVIKEIKPYTNYIYLHLKGEPLMHPQLEEILTICEDHNINVNLTTNGVFLVKQINLLFAAPALKRINISLQSLLNMTVMQQEVYLHNLAAFLKKAMQAQKFYLSLRLWSAEEMDKVVIFNQKIIDYLETILEVSVPNLPYDKPLVPKIYISKEDEFIWPSLENDLNSGLVKCLGGKQHLGILVDGTVTICCLDQEGSTNLGNVFNDGFKNILASDKYQKTMAHFSRHQPYLELCKHCTYHQRFQ